METFQQRVWAETFTDLGLGLQGFQLPSPSDCGYLRHHQHYSSRTKARLHNFSSLNSNLTTALKMYCTA